MNRHSLAAVTVEPFSSGAIGEYWMKWSGLNESDYKMLLGTIESPRYKAETMVFNKGPDWIIVEAPADGHMRLISAMRATPNFTAKVEKIEDPFTATVKQAWFPGKEEVVFFEQLAAKQVQIYQDAADHGILLPWDGEVVAPDIRANLQGLLKTYKVQSTSNLTKDRGGYKMWRFFIPVEKEGGQISGINLVITYNVDKLYKKRFISIDISRETKAEGDYYVTGSVKVAEDPSVAPEPMAKADPDVPIAPTEMSPEDKKQTAKQIFEKAKRSPYLKDQWTKMPHQTYQPDCWTAKDPVLGDVYLVVERSRTYGTYPGSRIRDVNKTRLSLYADLSIKAYSNYSSDSTPLFGGVMRGESMLREKEFTSRFRSRMIRQFGIDPSPWEGSLENPQKQEENVVPSTTKATKAILAQRYSEVSKWTVEQTAQIIGPSSAAAQALERAKTMTNPMFLKGKGTITVVDYLDQAVFRDGEPGEVIDKDDIDQSKVDIQRDVEQAWEDRSSEATVNIHRHALVTADSKAKDSEEHCSWCGIKGATEKHLDASGEKHSFHSHCWKALKEALQKPGNLRGASMIPAVDTLEEIPPRIWGLFSKWITENEIYLWGVEMYGDSYAWIRGESPSKEDIAFVLNVYNSFKRNVDRETAHNKRHYQSLSKQTVTKTAAPIGQSPDPNAQPGISGGEVPGAPGSGEGMVDSNDIGIAKPSEDLGLDDEEEPPKYPRGKPPKDEPKVDLFKKMTVPDFQRFQQLESERMKAQAEGNIEQVKAIEKEEQGILEKYQMGEPTKELSSGSFIARLFQTHTSLRRDMQPLIKDASEAIEVLAERLNFTIDSVSLSKVATDEYDAVPKNGMVEWILNVSRVGNPLKKMGIIQVQVKDGTIGVEPYIWNSAGKKFNLDSDGVDLFFEEGTNASLTKLEDEYMQDEANLREIAQQAEDSHLQLGFTPYTPNPTGPGSGNVF